MQQLMAAFAIERAQDMWLKVAAIVTVILIALVAFVWYVGGKEQALEADQRGRVSVDRIWNDGATDSGYALVSYVNDSGRTFRQLVSIRCDGFPASGQKLG